MVLDVVTEFGKNARLNTQAISEWIRHILGLLVAGTSGSDLHKGGTTGHYYKTLFQFDLSLLDDIAPVRALALIKG